jgi:excinuclease ABC subunit A
MLPWVIEQVEKLGEFSEPNWNSRTIVEVAAKSKSQGWFLHAMTGQEKVLRLVFRVAKNSFKQAELARKLAIPSLDDTQSAGVYGREDRVQVSNRKGPWQEVAVLAHRRSDIDTPAFRQFLKDAANAFGANLKKMLLKPEDVMPWKVNGERWHLSEKGFPIGRKIKWDRAILPRLLKIVGEIDPTLEIKWDTRDAILFYAPGISHSWARWRTKDDTGLDTRFVGPAGALNLSRLEGVGASQSFSDDRANGSQVMQIVFTNESHLNAVKLKALLAEHLAAFRESFGA